MPFPNSNNPHSSRCMIIPMLATLFAFDISAEDPEPESTGVSAKDSLALIHVPDGFEVQLVAAEPDVIDPVAFTWGPDGRLWVAEMTDYPLGMDGEGKPGGRIRWLRDTDGDGRYDESQIFAEDLSFPNSVLPWNKGVLVTAAPMILYLEDSDDDGKADKQEVLFDGFQEGNQQLRVNGLVQGLDNWIYCASGAHRANYGADNRVVSRKTGQEIALGSRDFRFNPATGELDPESGPSQFGRNRDDWGNWYGEMNSYPLWHYVLSDRYIRRNAHVVSPDPRKQLVLPKNPKVYPFKAPQKRFHGFEQTGRFTSACSGMVYRDTALFPESENDTIEIFTCEPFANLVQHNRSKPEGVSFSVSESGPVELNDGVDFFASKDRWCRPVMARTGPDGALWIADMYRYMIEHPQWLPEEGKAELRPFYRLGENQGRIYRIFRKGSKPRPVPNMGVLPGKSLVEALETDNGWQRDTAQSLLVERNDSSTIPLLKKLAIASKMPLARLHALYTLEGLGALDLQILKKATTDPSAGVRRHVVRLSESWANDHPDLLAAVLKLADDENAKVRLQLACSLGEWKEAAAATLGRMAMVDGGDPFLSAAILSSVNEENLGTVMSSLLSERKRQDEGGELVGPLLALAVAFDHQAALENALDETLANVSEPAWQYQAAAGLLDALERRTEESELSEKITERLQPLLTSARKTALDSKSPDKDRRAAIRLLGRNDDTRKSDVQALGALLNLETPATIQAAIVAHLGTISGPEIPEILLSGWNGFTPTIRTEVLNTLMTRTDRVSSLLDAIQSGSVPLAELDASNRQSLRTYPDKKIRERAIKLLPDEGGTRLEVVEAWRPALKLDADAERGKAVFQRVCIACHRLDGVGLEIGPNLASVTDRRPESMLSNILDPNASVEGRYATYVASTKDGRTLMGMLISETGANIILQDAANQEHAILRSELVSLQSLGRSFMPDGLEATMTKQDLADLIRYVREAK